jgi:hypothetical protein
MASSQSGGCTKEKRKEKKEGKKEKKATSTVNAPSNVKSLEGT